MTNIIDLHTHLDSLQTYVQLRSKLQNHKITINEHFKSNHKVILNLAFYMQFYQSFEDLIKLIKKYREIIETTPGCKLIKNKADLDSNYQIGFIFHLESARLIKHPENQLEQLSQLGVRGIIPLHFIDNQYGNSCDDFGRRLKLKSDDNGLTQFGKDLVEICNQKRMWIDISHATDRTASDILKHANFVVASHTGIREFKNFKRNIPLEHAKEIQNKNGLIGLIPWTHLIPNHKNGYRELVEFSLKSGLEKAIGIGTDFGAPIKTYKENKSIFNLAEVIDLNFKESASKIKSENALNFYSKLFQ